MTSCSSLSCAHLMQDFERALHAHEADVETAQQRYQTLPALQRSTQQVESRLSSVVERWQQLCAQSRLYAERTRAVETLQSSLQELGQLLAQYELTFGHNDALSADERTLKCIQQQLKVGRSYVGVLCKMFKYKKKNI